MAIINKIKIDSDERDIGVNWSNVANPPNYAGSSSVGGPATDFAAEAGTVDVYRYVYFADSDNPYNISESGNITKGKANIDPDFKYNPSTNTLTAGTFSGNLSGKAATAISLASPRTIDGVNFDGSTNIIHYGICSTNATTTDKAVACSGFVLSTGAKITVKFTVANTATNPTLNVNDTGGKAIYYKGSNIDADALVANGTYEFIYNGTQYELVGNLSTSSGSLGDAAYRGVTSSATSGSTDLITSGGVYTVVGNISSILDSINGEVV